MIPAAKVRYAIQAMLHLARVQTNIKRLPLRSIAVAQHIPEKFLGQIFLRLCASGLVGSARGTDGGYFLRRPACEISLFEVVKAIDKSVIERSPRLGTRQEEQVISSLWDRLTANVVEDLKISLESLSALVETPAHDWQI